MKHATYRVQDKVPGIVEAVIRATTQTELARLVGVSQQTVSIWVSQGYVPLKRAEIIEQLYDIDLSRLINPNFLEENQND